MDNESMKKRIVELLEKVNNNELLHRILFMLLKAYSAGD